MTLPNVFSKIDSSPEAYGILASPIMGWCPFLLDPQGAFLRMYHVSVAPRMGNMWPLDPWLKQNLAPFCSCHDYYLKISTGSKALLFILFQSSLPFRESKQEAGCKYLNLDPTYPLFQEIQTGFKCLAPSPSFSCPKKCKQEASCKYLAWGPSISCLRPETSIHLWVCTLCIKSGSSTARSLPLSFSVLGPLDDRLVGELVPTSAANSTSDRCGERRALLTICSGPGLLPGKGQTVFPYVYLFLGSLERFKDYFMASKT